MRWDDDFLMGATLPGCPLFAVTRTSRLAWGVTYLKGDTSDYFIEDCRQSPEGRWQYRRGERWIDFSVREEKILRKGHPPETLNVHYNPLGTLDADPAQLGEGLQLLTAWTGNAEGAERSVQTWLSLVECGDALSAMDLVRECPQPTLCWIFADRDGHIGRQANGLFPQRAAGYSGLLPIPAWDEANHWQGWLPSEVLPRVYDPPEGFVATANEDILADGGACLVTLPVPNYRKRRIDERLAQLDHATLADMQALQYDVVSLQARDLLEVFLPALPEGGVKDRLTAWDCGYGPESLEATIFSRLYRNVLLEIFGQDTGQHRGLGWRRMLYLCSRVGFAMPVVTSLDRLLKKPDSRWWEGRDKEQLIRKAAAPLGRSRPAVEQDQRLSFHQPVLRGRAGRATRWGCTRPSCPCPVAMPRRFKDICYVRRRARPRSPRRTTLSPTSARAKHGPTCRAVRAKAGFHAGIRTIFRAGARGSTSDCRSMCRWNDGPSGHVQRRGCRALK